MRSFVLLCLTLAVVSSKDFHGTNNSTQHIINGHNATEGQFPYQVALVTMDNLGNNYSCGGSLIDSEWVLTAADCLTDITSAEVRLGSIYVDDPYVSHIVDSENFILHEDYVEIEPYPNDIALIKIPKVEFTQNIQKIDLPKKSSSYPDYAGENGIITGWGETTDDPDSESDILKYNILHVISNRECEDIYDDILSKQICANSLESRACFGDGGGPLVLEKEPKVLIGVLFNISEICSYDYPNVFTRVTSYLDWIAENTGIEI